MCRKQARDFLSRTRKVSATMNVCVVIVVSVFGCYDELCEIRVAAESGDVHGLWSGLPVATNLPVRPWLYYLLVE
jgi:hypothetical protein